MLFSSAGPTKCQGRNRPSVLLQVERLEDRCVLSAAPPTFTPQLYTDLLQRAPDSQGLAFWQSALGQGASTFDVAQGFVNSREFQANEVASLYGKLLHRAPDQVGLAVYLPFLAAGGSVQQVEAMILSSDEFFATQGGGTNAGFLKALYLNVLDRTPDPIGQQFFMQALALGGSRLDVATAISTSTEADQDLVNSDYMAYLNRPADAVGLGVFVSSLEHGTRIEDVLAMITESPEYVTFSTVASNVSRINPLSTPFSNPFAGTYAGTFTGTASGVDDDGNPFSLDVSGSFTATIDNNGKITFQGTADQGGSGSGTGAVNPSGSSNINLATGFGSGVSSEGSGSGRFSGMGVLSGDSATFSGDWSGTGQSSTGTGHGSGSGSWTAVRQ